MPRLSVLLIIFAAIIGALGASSCSGAGGNAQPLRSSVDQPAADGPGFDLPDPAQVLRTAAATPGERFRFGNAYQPPLTANTAVDGTAIIFQPQFDLEAQPPLTEPAWAVWTFSLPDYSDEPLLNLAWRQAPADWATLWIGLSDRELSGWAFFTVDSALGMDLGDLAPYLYEGDKLAVVLMLTGTDQPELNWLRFGGPSGPEAVLSAEPTSGTAPLDVSLNANLSFGRETALSGFQWDFDNDGSFGEADNGEAGYTDLPAAQVQLAEAGTHTITVQVADGGGLSDTASVDIEVEAGSFTIAGRVADEEATGLPDITVTLTGDADDEVSTDENGDYSFTVSTGSYTVTPSGYGWFIDPPSADVEVSGADVSGVDFTAYGGWMHTWGNADSDEPNDLSLDADGNAYAVGRTNSDTGGDWDVLLVKYNRLGQFQWARQWGGDENEIGQCAAIDPDGNLWATGYTTSFGAGGYDLFVIKVSPGGDLLKQMTWGNVALQEAFDIEFDADGNPFIAGRLSNKTLLLKLDPEMNHVWGQLYWAEGSSFNYVKDLVIAGSDFYLGGLTYYSDTADYNALILKYDSAGALTWAREWSKGTEDMFDRIAIDNLGNLVCAGHCNAGNGAQDGLVASFTSAGSLNWDLVWGTTAFELFYALRADDARIIVAGLYGSSGRALLAGFSPADGALEFAQGFNMDVGSETCNAYGLDFFDNGQLLIAGYAPNINGAWEAVTGEDSGDGALIDPVILTNDTSHAGITQGDAADAVFQTVTGTQDTGGGGNDFLLATWLPPAQ